METMRLSNLCPQVFRNSSTPSSDIWRQDVVFQKGKLYLIEAASGTGKTTLCSYFCGIRNDYEGHLFFDSTDVATFSSDQWAEIRRCHISHLPQDLRLFPELTAYENIEIKNRLTGRKTKNQIMEWLDFLGLAEKKSEPLGKLSFGQQQRVAMLRALAQPFDFLIADEPISHLDDLQAQKMGELMTEEAKRLNASVIMTSIGKHLPLQYDNIYHL